MISVMRKFMISAAIFFAAVFSEARDYGSGQIYFYGADFSEVRVFCATEDDDSFTKAFVGINTLFLTEKDKYDLSHLFDKDVNVDINMMVDRISKNTKPLVRVYTMEMSSKPSAEFVASYELLQTEGVGVVLIARVLNKVDAVGVYDFVVFDISSREVIYEIRAEGRAMGFGLRNYWARTVYEIVSDEKLLSR